MLCCVTCMLCNVMLCHGTLCHVMPCRVMSYYMHDSLFPLDLLELSEALCPEQSITSCQNDVIAAFSKYQNLRLGSRNEAQICA